MSKEKITESGVKMTKQVIVIRKDLKMRRGKEIAQGCHASMSFLTYKLYEKKGFINKLTAFLRLLIVFLSKEQLLWCANSFAKVVVYVKSEEELKNIINLANSKKLTVHSIVDSGKTEFNDVPTLTCAAIGPHYAEKFEGVTDKLPLY